MIFPEFSGILIYNINPNLQRLIMYKDNIGKKFGKWLILGITHIKSRIKYIVQCECGTTSTPNAYSVVHGLTSACKFCGPKHHGYDNTPTNRSWSGAKNRCRNVNNKDYVNYGARGIKMCERWNIFENFLADMGEKPEGLTLDRIDNNGDYEPGNCRWATMSQQNSNQRKRSSKT